MLEQVTYYVAPLVAIVAMLVVAIASLRRIVRSDLTSAKASALDQFNKWLASNSAAQLGLSIESCEIVQESETIGQDRTGEIYSYTLTRFMRSANGQYVMFKSTPRGPYTKPVSRSVAKAVLKEKYAPPPNG